MTAILTELFGLAGRTAIVTGGSSGIGYAIAEALGSAGARVVLIARRPGPLAEAHRRLTEQGITCATVEADLSDLDTIDATADAATTAHGEPDILVTAAGVNLRPPLPELTTAEWRHTLDLNLDAPYRLGQRFGPGMAERGHGRIINIGSQQSFNAFGNSGAYGVSKAAICGLTRSQAEAWSPHGVCCNTLIPGFVSTPLTADTFAIPGRAEQLAARTMAKRNGEPRDFAAAALFLAGAGAAYVTGQTIAVDGGFSVH
ncbi:SDR family NAD(P)-dependent oxidoreductase [Stackebrandtia soli]|uniref:SDR family NAD(P)-dependent oxidoreductase n=1 Tax=Stackebrandtia soli TaxID=1892856 RepID=UPI0039E9908A